MTRVAKWIRFSEQQPKPRQRVLVSDGKDVEYAVYGPVDGEPFFYGELYRWPFSQRDVKFWMAIPEIPDEA
jgi:hypothetical protein